MTIIERLKQINLFFILLLIALTSVGIMMLYSAGGGSFYPWAIKQSLRFCFGFSIMIITTCIDIRRWYHWSYGIYFIALTLLFLVEILGVIGMGAQRWLDLYIFNLQPSELMKISLILALSRYFHGLSLESVHQTKKLIIPSLMILIPTALVLRQPDLGTAIMLITSGIIIFFLSGIQIWKFLLTGACVVGLSPFLWHKLHAYQQKRILVFFNPELDPTHSGYHVMQSKIALGSGGIWGKGYMQGTQSHLNFLPEKQTDFIFTMFCEEWGFVGALCLLALYLLIIVYGYKISLKSRNHFVRFLSLGVVSIFFFYMFINMSMVMGLIPAVGVPLPLMSYGGTSMLTVLFSFGLMLSGKIYNDQRLKGNLFGF